MLSGKAFKLSHDCVFSQLPYINLLSTVTHGIKDSGGVAARSVSGAAAKGRGVWAKQTDSMGKRGGRSKSTGSGAVKFAAPTEPVIAKLLVAACAQTWEPVTAAMYSERILRAGPWSLDTLRTITQENATAKVGLPNMRRLQVTEIAHQVADALGRGAGDAGSSNCGSSPEDNESHSAIKLAQPELEGLNVQPAQMRTQVSGGQQSPSRVQDFGATTHRETERQVVENAAPLQARAAAQETVQGSASGQVENAAPGEQSTAYVAIDVVHKFVGLLTSHNYRPLALQRVVQGSEQQWEKAVKAAVQDMQQEFKVEDMLQKWTELCDMGRELFLRELRGKATRILAHKKRHTKIKK